MQEEYLQKNEKLRENFEKVSEYKENCRKK